ncbi:hypothetical protein DEJ49_02470 [Streptomyces venezuelae]|uniref:Secreted protein n=1 Tax=Streptomyces venezuelae TaxID=54571 RepID=A0A5P2CFB7_STRVZ|nr:hypothetical protein [Streptomyces venezuelae]QES39991.1 hypothetical protein DEJ49_02470 [Streptomyces venezuelae]
MTNRGRILKITAALTLSTLALTGFTTGRGHGGGSRHSDGGGGGGCSNSSQDHDSSSSSSSGGTSGSSTSGSGYDDDDDVYGGGDSGDGGRNGSGTHRRLPTEDSTSSSSSGSGGKRTEDATAKLVRCATKAAPYATVEVTNKNDKAGRFWVSVTFVDADGITVVEQSEKVKVPGNGKATTRVEVGGGGLADSVRRCEVDPQALPVSA